MGNSTSSDLRKSNAELGPYIVSLDAGTTSTRAILFNDKAKMLLEPERRKHEPNRFGVGCVEYNAFDLLDAAIAVILKSITNPNVADNELRGLTITNQRETFVTWDCDTGEPYAPAIVWQDFRTAKECEALRNEGDNAKKFKERSGLIISPYFTVSKLAWLQKDNAKLRDGIEKGKAMFGTLDTWFVWQLTNRERFLTDTTNASRVGLYNLKTKAWDSDLKKMFGIDERLRMPEIRPCNDSFGVIKHKKFAGTPMFGKPILAVIGDQHSALVGNGCLSKGDLKTTFGTGAFSVLNTGPDRIHSEKLLTTVAYHIKGQSPVYALEGAIGSCGTAISALVEEGRLVAEKGNKEDVTNDPDIAKMEAVLGSVDNDAGGVVCVPAITGLFAPYWCFNAMSCTYFHSNANNANFVHATFQGIAHQVADVLKVAQKDTGVQIKEHRVDGGVSNNNPLMQVVADYTRETVRRSKNAETTALGAALIAGLNDEVAVYSGIDKFAAYCEMGESFKPQGDEVEIARKRKVWAGCVDATVKAAEMMAKIE